MKRGELKRTKPMKRSAIKKPKKKKTALQKRIDKMDSKYWGNQCKRDVTRWAHCMRCFVCGAEEPFVDLVCGHHNIFKSMSRFYRWDPMNIVPMCGHHHLWDADISPHNRKLPLAVSAYTKELQAKMPDHYAWWVEHEALRKAEKLTVGFIRKPDWRKQAGIWRLIADKAEEAAQDR